MQNGMKDKLIELLESAESAVYWSSADKSFIEKIAEHLINNGVIVLPCKVGDTVYVIGNTDGHRKIKECRLLGFEFESAKDFQANVSFECDTNCDGCYFSAWGQTYCGEYYCDGEYGSGVIPIDDFGKTVFLTKEEAEQALKEREKNAE